MALIAAIPGATAVPARNAVGSVQKIGSPAKTPKAPMVEFEVGVHGQLGEADVHPVEIGDEIAEDQEGDELPRDSRQRLPFEVVRHAFLPRFARPALAPVPATV
jgi:hypothetical protein